MATAQPFLGAVVTLESWIIVMSITNSGDNAVYLCSEILQNIAPLFRRRACKIIFTLDSNELGEINDLSRSFHECLGEV